jgi:hypothetical protein
VATRAHAHSPEKAWLLRALLVLQSPRSVFAALRDDSDETAGARQEAITAIVWLAGMAAVLASPAMNDLMDDPARDGLVVAIVVFFAGGLYGLVAYWLLAGVLHVCVRTLGSQGTYRRSRHLVGFALAPIALALLTFWPVRIAVEGRALFQYGGADKGHVFADLFYAFVAWTAVLAAIGVRTVHGWAWPRALVASGAAVGAAALIVLGSSIL